LSCPFVSKGSVKRKQGNCFDEDWTDKLAASDQGSYFKQHEFEEEQDLKAVEMVSSSHMKLAAISWHYSSVLILWTRKQFVSLPIQFITFLTQLLESMISLGFSLESVVLAFFPASRINVNLFKLI